MMFVFNVISRQEPAKVMGKVTIGEMSSSKAESLAKEFYPDMGAVKFAETLHVRTPRYKKFNR